MAGILPEATNIHPLLLVFAEDVHPCDAESADGTTLFPSSWCSAFPQWRPALTPEGVTSSPWPGHTLQREYTVL